MRIVVRKGVEHGQGNGSRGRPMARGILGSRGERFSAFGRPDSREGTIISSEGEQLAAALIAALKQDKFRTALKEPMVELSGSWDQHPDPIGIDIEAEIATSWTCDECGIAKYDVAWSVRFDQSMCMECNDAAIALTNQEGTM